MAAAGPTNEISSSLMLRIRIDPVPALQVREQARGNRDRRLAFIGLRATLFPAVVAPALQVDI